MDAASVPPWPSFPPRLDTRGGATMGTGETTKGRHAMPRGDKSKYTTRQKRQAAHVEEGYERRGVTEPEAERRAWATVNEVSGGGRKRAGAQGRKGATARGTRQAPATVKTARGATTAKTTATKRRGAAATTKRATTGR